MIAFILCLCLEPAGEVVADHRLHCDSEVKLIMKDFLTLPSQRPTKSTPTCHTAVSEAVFHAFIMLRCLVGFLLNSLLKAKF